MNNKETNNTTNLYYACVETNFLQFHPDHIENDSTQKIL